MLDLARTSLKIKRKVIQRQIDAGLLPYTQRYLGSLHNHLSTICVNGINECIRNFTRDTSTIVDHEGQRFACWLLQPPVRGAPAFAGHSPLRRATA